MCSACTLPKNKFVDLHRMPFTAWLKRDSAFVRANSRHGHHYGSGS